MNEVIIDEGAAAEFPPGSRPNVSGDLQVFLAESK
jgi:hypothetical protein